MKAKKTPSFHFWLSADLTVINEPIITGTIVFLGESFDVEFFNYCPTTGQIW